MSCCNGYIVGLDETGELGEDPCEVCKARGWLVCECEEEL